jgi:hypothetical protein
MDNQAWVVDKKNANTPIVKISKSDFNLIKSGIFKNQGNKVDFNGRTYYLPTELMNKIKIKTKSYNIDFSNLAISLQEFMDKSLIEEMKFEINKDVILELKNNIDDIYIICSKQTKRTYETIIEKIKEEFEKNGLKIKTFYPISENFMNQNDDDIKFKKMRLLLQHLVGYKTEGDKFTDEKLEQYDEIYYYDDEETSTQLACDSNKLLMVLLSNTESSLKDIIKDDLKSTPHNLFVNYITGNRVNRFVTTKLLIQFSNLIKTFESFKWK